MGVCNPPTPLNILKIPHFLNFLGWVTCNPPCVLVWIRPWPLKSVLRDVASSPVFRWCAQETRGVDPMLVQCWPAAAGPTLNHHWANASCLLVLSVCHIFCVNIRSRRNSENTNIFHAHLYLLCLLYIYYIITELEDEEEQFESI